MSHPWLPPLVPLADSGGNWDQYLDTLYQHFQTDFLNSLPRWPGKRVGLKRHPLRENKEATFWHFISEGDDESARNLDEPRCERIRWPRATMESFTNQRPKNGDRIVWWKNQRGQESSFILALADFSYLTVVRDRGEYVLPWTHYIVELSHRREKHRREYEAYWKGQNG